MSSGSSSPISRASSSEGHDSLAKLSASQQRLSVSEDPNTLTYILNSIFSDNDEESEVSDHESSLASTEFEEEHSESNQGGSKSFHRPAHEMRAHLQHMKHKLRQKREQRSTTGSPRSSSSTETTLHGMQKELQQMKKSMEHSNAQMLNSLSQQLDQVLKRASFQQQASPSPHNTPPLPTDTHSSSYTSSTLSAASQGPHFPTASNNNYSYSSQQNTAAVTQAPGASLPPPPPQTSSHFSSTSQHTTSVPFSSTFNSTDVSSASDLRHEILNQSTKIKILDEQLNEARQTISTQSRKISLIDKERSSELRSTTERYETELTSLQHKYNLAEKRSNTLERDLAAERKQNKSLKKELSSIRQNLAEYQVQIDSQKSDYERMANVVHQLRAQEQNWIQKDQKYHTVEEKYHQLVQQMDTLRTFSEEVDQRNKSLQEENERLKEEYEERQHRSDSDYEQVIRKLTNSLEKSTEQADKLKHRVKQLEKERDSLEESSHAQEDKVKQLSQHNEELQSMLDAEKRGRRVDVTSAQEVFDNKLQEAYSRERSHKEKLRECKDALKSVEEKYEKVQASSKQEIDTWHQRFDEEREMRERLESALSKAKKRIESELKSRMSQKSRTRELEMQVDVLNRKKSQDSTRIHQLEEKVSELQDNVAVYREMYESLTQSENQSPALTQYQTIRRRQLSLSKTIARLDTTLKAFIEDFQVLENNYRKMQHILKEIQLQHENGEDDEISVTDLHLLNNLQLQVDKNITDYKDRVVKMVDTLQEDREKFDELKKGYRKFEKRHKTPTAKRSEHEEIAPASESSSESDTEQEEEFSVSRGPSPRRTIPRGASKMLKEHGSHATKREKGLKSKSSRKRSAAKSTRSQSRPKSRRRRAKSPSAASITHKLAEELRQLQQQRTQLLSKRKRLTSGKV